MTRTISRLVVAAVVVSLGRTGPPPSGRAQTIAAEPASTRLAPDVGIAATGRADELRPQGYVEREIFLEGTAQAYAKVGEWDGDGRWHTAPADRAPFRVRMLARYPSDPARFNGIVFVEWLNVSGQTEGDPNFSLLHVELIRRGYGYVGVGAQRAGIEGAGGLRKINAKRYEALVHPGDSYSYDIYSQAGRAVRTPRGAPPLGALTAQIRYLVADGESQSAGRMVTYVNAVHPTANVYDAFYVHSRGGGAAPLAQDADNKATIPAPSPARLRRDVKVPIIQIQAETDVPNFIGARQPDDTGLRTWELAGTAHGDRYMLTGGGTRSLQLRCHDPDPKLAVPINDGPMTYSMRAALRQMERWVAGGAPPPSAPPLALAATDARPGEPLARDQATGIALGGVRTPHVDVPVRTLNGIRAPAGGGGFCRLFGRTDEWNGDADPWDGTPADPSPTPEPVLSKLYPSKSVFLSRFEDAMDKGIEAGFLLRDDAEQMRAEAGQVRWTGR